MAPAGPLILLLSVMVAVSRIEKLKIGSCVNFGRFSGPVVGLAESKMADQLPIKSETECTAGIL